jgi:hypothetical protein
VLFLGDCACALGLIPNEIRSATGLRAQNLGTMGVFGPEGHSLLLESLIHARGAPRYLIYQASVVMLSRVPNEHWNRRLREWLGPRAQDKAWHLPSYRIRNVFQNAVLRLSLRPDYPESILEQPLGVPDYPLTDNTIRSVLGASCGYLPRIERDAPLPAGLEERGRYERANDDGLRRLLQVASERKVRVLLTLTPMPASSRTAETDALLSDVLANVQRLVGRRTAEVDIRGALYYPDELFVQMYHLNERGAARNTREVAEWIRAQERTLKASEHD